MTSRFTCVSLAAAAFAVAVSLASPAAAQSAPATPAEMVATYNTLADGLLALKGTESNLVKAILAATKAHGEVQLARATRAISANDAAGAKAAIEALAADVAQLGTEGDNSVAAVRKRLIEGGQHHNAAGEAQGIYEEGYVIVTRAAKAKFLESSRKIAGMAAQARRGRPRRRVEGRRRRVRRAAEGGEVAARRRTPRLMVPARRGRMLGPCAALAAAILVAAAGSGVPTAQSPHFRFVDVHEQAGVTRPLLAGRPGKDHLLDSAGAGVAFLDYDRDGRLDLYLVNGWKVDGSTIVEKGVNALYRGLPDGTFEDVTDRAGVGGEGRWGQGAFVADYDDDGWPDILVTAFGPNVLYRNNGDGTLRERGRDGRPRVARLEHRRRLPRRRRRRRPRRLHRRLHRQPRSTTCCRRSGRCRGRASRWWRSARSA